MSTKGKEIVSGSSAEVVGSGLSGKVVDQLIAREKLISTPNKDNNQLLFFNGNGAWARLVSSVNTLDKAETEGLATGTKTIKDVTGASSLANFNVLMGGSLKQGTPEEPTSLNGGVNESLYNPINIDLDGYATAGNTNNSAYNKYESLGFRPTPGIKDVSVKSKGTYGTLREAEVSVSVWTLEDLEMMQALYLRPGYTVLLEWGHSLQLDSTTGQVRKDIGLYRKFLKNRVPVKTIEKDLRELQDDADYNYDSMYGYVSNFSWSFNSDGGYDCKIKIISKGSVLESIALTFDTSDTYPADQLSSWTEDTGKKERRSIYHKFFVELERLVGSEREAQSDTRLAYGNVITATEASSIRAQELIQDSPTSLYGQALQADPTFGPEFNRKIGLILSGSSFVWPTSAGGDGSTVSWTAASGSMPFADMEAEPAEYYLNREFKEYGLEFTGVVKGFADDEIHMLVPHAENKVFEFEFDNNTDALDQKYTLELVVKMREYAKIPGS